MKASKLSFSFLLTICLGLFLSFKNNNAQQSLKNSTNKILIDSVLVGDNKTELSKRLQQAGVNYNLSELNKIDSLALKTLIKKTSVFYEIKAYDSAIYYTKILRDLSLKLKDTSYIAKSFKKLGFYYLESKQPIKSFKNYNESKKHYISLNDSSEIGRILLDQSIIQQDLSDYLGSEKTAISTLKYLKPNKDKRFIASAYNTLAINSDLQNNYNEAVYWYEKAIKETENESDALVYKNNLALVYLSLKKYKKGIALLSESSKNYYKKNKKEDPGIIDNIIYAKWLEDSTYNPTNGVMKNLKVHLNKNDIDKTFDSYMLLAKYNLNKKRDKATEYATKALEASKKIKNKKSELEALRLLIDINPTDGYNNYVENYLRINDSINNAILKVKNQFAKIIYDTDKTRDVNLLLNAKIAKDSLRIAQETYRRNLGILISSLLVLSVLFIVFNWRQRIKIARFNATTKTENRISKKVHDEMANDISNIKTLIKNHISANVPVKKQLLNMLDTTYLNARDIASETGDVIFSESFGDDIKNLLMQHNNENIKIITNLSTLNSLKMDKYKKVAIYRTLQELMVNMNKHSYATRVIIAHKKEGKYNEIRYTDNGIGNDVIKKNNGLDNAASRMNDIKGFFSFETSKDNGFKALLKFKA